MNHNPIVKQELEAAGSKPQEAAALARLSTSIGELKQLAPQPLAMTRPRRRRLRLVLPAMGLTTGGLVAGVVLVALAQTSLPGGGLYPVKRVSEAIAVRVQPDYRGMVMMRRAQEVHQLVAGGSSPRLVASTLQDYSNDMAVYRAQGNQNYAAFRYCQSSLQQAAAQSSGAEHQEIAATLAALPADIN